MLIFWPALRALIDFQTIEIVVGEDTEKKIFTNIGK
jgi:hypothetical protein